MDIYYKTTCKKCGGRYSKPDIEYYGDIYTLDGIKISPDFLKIICPVCKFSYYELCKDNQEKMNVNKVENSSPDLPVTVCLKCGKENVCGTCSCQFIK